MKISVLNMDGKYINKDCLAQKVKEVLSKVDDGKIVPYRVKIWQDHTLVKEALRGVTVRIERENGKQNILFPVKDHGSKIILYDHDKYVLYGIEGGKIHFEECFTK